MTQAICLRLITNDKHMFKEVRILPGLESNLAFLESDGYELTVSCGLLKWSGTMEECNEVRQYSDN